VWIRSLTGSRHTLCVGHRLAACSGTGPEVPPDAPMQDANGRLCTSCPRRRWVPHVVASRLRPGAPPPRGPRLLGRAGSNPRLRVCVLGTRRGSPTLRYRPLPPSHTTSTPARGQIPDSSVLHLHHRHVCFLWSLSVRRAGVAPSHSPLNL